MIDLNDPNVIDVEITSHINGKLGLTMGIGINRGTTLISSIPMSVEVFKKHLPESALASHINTGGVVLKPIILKTSDVKIVKDPSIIDLTVDSNPFTHEVSKVGDTGTAPEIQLEDENPFLGGSPEDKTPATTKPVPQFGKKK